MTKLGVNIDHIATLRQARRALEPDPVAAALLAELAGADSITIHLRQDRRHIQDDDVLRLRAAVTTRLNIELAATDAMVRIIRKLHPDQATLVPERPDEITTEGGLDVAGNSGPVAGATKDLTDAGIGVSLFIDPDPEQVDAAAGVGARMVELNTRAFSEAAPRSPDLAGEVLDNELTRILRATERARDLGIRVLAGHGLTYRNVRPVSAIPEIEELNIGHNILARAALVGIERAVREMLRAMNGAD